MSNIMSNISNNSSGVGNTKTTPRLRRAHFVLNNYTEEECISITQEFDHQGYKYVIGKEIGENGTPHLQGYVEFNKQVYFTYLQSICSGRIHWENVKGTRDQNIKYCTKQCIFAMTFKPDLRQSILLEYEGVKWREWQKEIIDIIDGPIDNRCIYWFYDKEGNTGKSFLAKYLVIRYNAIIGDGKKMTCLTN